MKLLVLLLKCESFFFDTLKGKRKRSTWETLSLENAWGETDNYEGCRVNAGLPVSCVEFLDGRTMEAINKGGLAGRQYTAVDSLNFHCSIHYSFIPYFIPWYRESWTNRLSVVQHLDPSLKAKTLQSEAFLPRHKALASLSDFEKFNIGSFMFFNYTFNLFSYFWHGADPFLQISTRSHWTKGSARRGIEVESHKLDCCCSIWLLPDMEEQTMRLMLI